jgi:ATPase subunit of ABC transporter with duplicated ATPase domains
VTAVLTVQELHKRFGDRRVLNGASFVVDERDRIGLIGANGAGKSTLLKMIVVGAGAGVGVTVKPTPPSATRSRPTAASSPGAAT